MSTSAPIVSSVEEKNIPNFELAQLVHRYENLIQSRTRDNIQSVTESEALINDIIKIITDDDMSTFYIETCNKYGWSIDEEKLAGMRDKNSVELAGLNKKYEEAVKTAGDLELLDITLAKGKYFCRIGEWSSAVTEFDAIIKKEKAGSGRKIDAHFEKAKIALFNKDISGLKAILAEAAKLVESGGDWDRKNKLKIFEAFYGMITRDIKKASSLLLDGIATFSSTEICDYQQFMFYAIVSNLLMLSRNELKKKIIDNAHVISVMIDAAKLRDLVDSLYSCNYKLFMRNLVALEPDILADRYLGSHCVYIMREYRILAFKQFLEAYKSITLSSMANSFGISSSMLDRELSHFIATGRLSAKIDKVGDIVETVKSDKKNAQYQEIIKKGDVLLNQIQKLVRVIDQ